ncbi:hypothetical protein Gaha_0058_001 [Novacetimonas hansenii JCM 7643]|nr:hypothetical protein Gaha_0058_001 [Novacetimonas hansenii JCM 7643]GBQ54127.1 hypothetical protein AA0243_0539 [Novacetimonas hansenii NRIC 0243]
MLVSKPAAMKCPLAADAILVRGVAEDGSDLVISRDYIKDGLRARAQDLVTQELGQRNDVEIHRALERQVDAEY